MTYYVYLHCKPDGTPFYVGKGSGKRSREFTVSRTKRHRNTIAKYGRGNIGIFVFPCDSQSQALADEAQWIKQLREQGHDLVNITNGGDGPSGYVHTAEDRRKMSEKLIGNTRWRNRVFSDEALRNLANAARGKKQSAETIAKRVSKLRGKTRSEETKTRLSKGKLGFRNSEATRARLSELAKNRVYSAETRAKMAAAQCGRRHSPETRAKMSAVLLGNKRLLGKTLSTEHRAAISAGRRRQIAGCA